MVAAAPAPLVLPGLHNRATEPTRRTKIVAGLLRFHDRCPIYSKREESLLLMIAVELRSGPRHRWALRELSRRVAMLEWEAGTVLDS